MTTETLLSIRGLGRDFGRTRVIDALDLTLDFGDRVGLHGPNGSGKSTLIRCVAGALEPTRGEVTILGHRAGSFDARRLVGASLAQERSFYMRLTGEDNLRFVARVREPDRAAADRSVASLIEELELGDIAARRVDRCSTGMIQQLALARALIGDPAVVLLDEPTRSLDDGAVARLWAALDRRPAPAVLIASHDTDDLDRCQGRLELPR